MWLLSVSSEAAHDEIERGQPVVLLRAVEDVDRVVGRVDDAHVAGVVPLGHLGGEARGVRRRRVLELVDEGPHDTVVLRAPLADVAVGADGEVVVTRPGVVGEVVARAGPCGVVQGAGATRVRQMTATTGATSAFER